MLENKASSSDFISSALALAKPVTEGVGAGGIYTLECFDKDGKLKWEHSSHNLVVNVGLQDMNSKYFLGSSYTATWFIGLITGPGSGTTIIAGNTMTSHAGWNEDTNYSNATRPTATFGSASLNNPSVISNSVASGGTLATFNINGGSTIAGAFLVSNSTKGGTTGILFSASDFQSPGDRVVVSGDTLNVTYQFSLTAT
jgi:hypothetical protein